ncbi:hypothetical protein ABID59_004353 [Bradyrhizobium sp. S3.3.6]|uniref:protein DpdG n=1 Tax=Bradyrhizobium sp. S3.3.6 TaxID=3156429 RepID=UPI0033971C62
MSIITTAPAVPSRLFALYSALLPSAAGELKDRFESWATPPSIRTRGASDDAGERPTELFSSALREAKKLGLIEEDDERIKVTEEARGKSGKTSPEVRFKSHLVKVLFDPLRAEAAGQTGFAMALAWFLRRNPLEPMGFGDDPRNELRNELGDDVALTELTNLNSFQNFIYWARYLGFATLLGTKETRWTIPDPFSAIREVLPGLFAEASELPINILIAGLARIYPVFEGGVSRLTIEQLALSPDVDANSRRLSPATSLALQRLLSLTIRADAPAVIFDFGGSPRRVSHVAKKAN